MSPLQVVLVILLFLLILLVLYLSHCFTYWTRRGFQQLTPSFPWGNTPKPFIRGLHFGIITSKWYSEMKEKRWKLGGVYGFWNRFLVVVDPELVGRVMVQDFERFNSRGLYYDERIDPLSGSILTYTGEQWKNMRVKMSPSFTGAKIRAVADIMSQRASDMVQLLLKKCENNENVEMKELAARFTTDVIGSFAFGVNCNSVKNPEAEFRKYSKMVFADNKWVNFFQYCTVVAPELSKKLRIGVTDKSVIDFFSRALDDTVDFRRKNDYRRNDFLQVLLDADDKGKEDFLGQCFTFFVAGFETSSTTISFALLELAKNPEIQEKARLDVMKALGECGGVVGYESVQEMKYLQQVVDETLRMYPPKPNVPRMCIKDYKVPGTDLVIEKGTSLLISLYGLHNDPEYFPNPEKFDPERFSEENKPKIKPYTYIPFGDGPRICIGMRFGLQQVKIGLASILKNFRVYLTPLTSEADFIPEAFLLLTSNDLLLRFEKL